MKKIDKTKYKVIKEKDNQFVVIKTATVKLTDNFPLAICQTREQAEEYLKNKSPEHLANMGLSHRGKGMSDKDRARISLLHKGKPKSPEHRAKMSAGRMGEKNPMFGKIVSEETRQKMSTAGKGKKKPREFVEKLANRKRDEFGKFK